MIYVNCKLKCNPAINDKNFSVCVLISYIGINLFRCFAKFDIEDEAAVEHYHRAKRKIFDFLWGFCSGFGAVGVIAILLAESRGYALAEKLSFNISFWHFLLVYYSFVIQNVL